MWVEIQITEIKVGIQSLWKHTHYFGQKHSYGFILVDEQIENMIEMNIISIMIGIYWQQYNKGEKYE